MKENETTKNTLYQLEEKMNREHWGDIQLFEEEDNRYSIAVGKAILLIKELEQYKAIGTVEEFKDLKEKNEPKKVVVEHVQKTSWTREVSHYLCPCCNNIFSFGGTTYCSTCGQKIDWK